jgi:SAM-dependent methyltransferase
VIAQPTRYSLRNSTPEEARRLGSLEALHDGSTIRQFERLGVGAGWHCVELGAGKGSIARWLAARVGPQGSVTAVDLDTGLLEDLRRRANVNVVEGDMTTMDFGTERFDLVHTRSVLMHVHDPDSVVRRLVPALRPGGVVLFEETDGAPAQRAMQTGEVPVPFAAVMMRLATRWTWARGLAARLVELGLVDVHDDVRDDALTGASPAAAFWQETLRTIGPMLIDTQAMAAIGESPIDPADLDTVVTLLDDPSFTMPFAARHRVSGRRPGSFCARQLEVAQI